MASYKRIPRARQARREVTNGWTSEVASLRGECRWMKQEANWGKCDETFAHELQNGCFP